MQWEKNSRKGKQRNKCRKNIIGLKKLKIKIIKNRKEKKKKRKKTEKRKTPQNCKSPMYRQRLMTMIKNVTEEKEKLKIKKAQKHNWIS